MRSPCASTMPFAIARPMPVPLVSKRCRLPRKNLSNTRARSFSSIPGPRSPTPITILSPSTPAERVMGDPSRSEAVPPAAKEFVEHAGALVLFDSGTAIPDSDHNSLTFDAGREGDGRSLRRILQRILDDLFQHLRDELGVGFGGREAFRHTESNGPPLQRRGKLQERGGNQLRRRDGPFLQVQLAGFNAGQIGRAHV